MDDLLAQPLAQPRMSAILLAGFAFVSMLLAAIGLYGVMASAVRSSMRELGVRAALGASPERLRRGVLSQALAVTGTGAIVGLVVALAASRLLTKLLFEVSPADPSVDGRLGGSAADRRARRRVCAGPPRDKGRPSTSTPIRIINNNSDWLLVTGAGYWLCSTNSRHQ